MQLTGTMRCCLLVKFFQFNNCFVFFQRSYSVFFPVDIFVFFSHWSYFVLFQRRYFVLFHLSYIYILFFSGVVRSSARDDVLTNRRTVKRKQVSSF